MASTPSDAPETRWYDLPHRPLRSLRVGAPRVGVPEIALVPGLGALGYLMPLVRACGRWTRVHLLDVPGFGHPRTSRCAADLLSSVVVVQEWLAAVPYRGLVLAGHSTGAQIALRAALGGGPASGGAPPGRERVGSVVLAGPTFPPNARRWTGLATGVVRTLRHESLGEVPATFREYLRGGTGVVTLLRTAMADRPDEFVPRVQVPLLVLRGERDRVACGPWAARLAGLAPHGELRTVPGAHNFCWTHPAPASAALHAAVTAWGGP